MGVNFTRPLKQCRMKLAGLQEMIKILEQQGMLQRLTPKSKPAIFQLYPSRIRGPSTEHPTHQHQHQQQQQHQHRDRAREPWNLMGRVILTANTTIAGTSFIDVVEKQR